MMFHIWRHAEDQSLWALNCLIYCGARATILLAKDDKGKHALHERIDDEGDEEATMPVERDHWQGSEEWTSIRENRASSPTRIPETSPNNSQSLSENFEGALGGCNRRLPEGSTLVAKLPAKSREPYILGRLKKRFVKGTFTVRRLKTLLEKQKSLLRIKICSYILPYKLSLNHFPTVLSNLSVSLTFFSTHSGLVPPPQQ